MGEERIIEKPGRGKFLVGINYPWIDYGWDFGDPPAAWVNPENVSVWRENKRRQIDDDFRAFAEMGLFAVRWFVLADGLSYGVGGEAPGLIDGKWTFDPLPAEHPFHLQLCDDFEYVLQTCVKHGLQFLPSLIDFHWCHRGSVVDANAEIVKGGRADVVREKWKRNKFFDNVLEPLLDISMRCPEAIYAWELINEPEWITETRPLERPKRNSNKTVLLHEMQRFIESGVGRINSRVLADGRAAFRSSVGFAHWDAIDQWDSAGMGVTLHQFHYYAPDKREIPRHNFTPETPCFIGEFASTFHRGWPDLGKEDKAGTIIARLSNLASKGYPSAFLWSSRAVDEATAWGEADRDETIGFINSLREEIA